MKRNLIIDGRQKRGKRVVEFFITLSGWFYIALFILQFTLSMILWWSGARYVRRFIFSNGYAGQTIHLFIFTLEFGAVALFITLLWSYYNKFRYGKLRRRKMPTSVSVSELVEEFHVTEEIIENLQKQNWVDVEEEIGDLPIRKKKNPILTPDWSD